MSKILLAHGSGGDKGRELVRDVFARHFSNPVLDEMGDSAVLNIEKGKLAFTTDSYVVNPVKFRGGDIGKLSICGTVNDLAVAGARPLYISASFIIEEGLEISLLDEIAYSMAKTAREAEVRIVAGDTKVVEHGKCDRIFITTSGIGEIVAKNPMTPSRIRPGDSIIINGTVADHGMAIMAAREGLAFETKIESDCAPLHKLAMELLNAVPDVRFMRDATRGGLAAVLNEAASEQDFGIEIIEEKIPISEGTAATCEILGIDPLYVANEGKLVAFVPKECAEAALHAFKSNPLGTNASVIGHVTSDNKAKVSIVTPIGTKRLVAMPSGSELPRIC